MHQLCKYVCTVCICAHLYINLQAGTGAQNIDVFQYLWLAR